MNGHKNRGMRTETRYFLLERPQKKGVLAAGKSALRWVQAGKYRLLLNRTAHADHIRIAQEKKYKVSICAIFKDEEEFLKEWLEFHLMVGIEHFYMYNNNSSDGCLGILKPYMDKGVVTLVDWEAPHAQMAAYADAIEKYSGETKWIGFIDLDEFVVPVKGRNIYRALEPFNDKAGAVVVYWRYFGSSGIARRDPYKLVTEQFTAAYPKYLDIGKCFYNTDFEFGGDVAGKNNVLHHVLWCKWQGHDIPPVNLQNRISFMNHNVLHGDDLPLQLNHYVTKAKEDYIRKMKAKTDVFFEKNPRSISQFEAIDKRCTGKDEKILRLLPELKSRMEEKR